MGCAVLRSCGLICIVALVLSNVGTAFKEHEFKKCSDASFCRRHRFKPGNKYAVDAESVSVSGPVVSATVQNLDYNKQLHMSLTAYGDGFVRVEIDEQPSTGRYAIQDIIDSSIEKRKLAWTKTSLDSKATTVTIEKASVVINHKPFRLTISINGEPAVTLNGRDLFNFEHQRTREEPGGDCDGCWEETFLGFTDSKPRGPAGISLDIMFTGFEHVYGLPEHATNFALKPTTGDSEPYRLYNLDVFEYLDNSPFGLYGAIPMMMAHKKGLNTGVFWLNAAEMFVDVAKVGDSTATQWIAESGIVDLFVFLGPSPADVVRQYSRLTGTTAMPQLFSIAYHQCRWNYKDEADVHQVDGGFDTHEIPYDVMWLDIEHTVGKRYLTFESSLFPDPEGLQEDLAARGRKMVTIVDPHVKRDHSYYIFSEAEQAGHFVKNKHGSDFDGWCWPGQSSYLDVTSPAVRQWWAQQFAFDKYKGSTKHLYIWNDMNEPSVFNGPEITMHKDNLHTGNVEHRDVHNLYGLYYHMATAEGLVQRGYSVRPEGDRPFVLSRAFFAGTQTVGPIWTGDNTADWKHLKISVPMLLSLGIAGLPFSGADVGGFFGNPDAELMTRWYQLGTFYPFFRGHAHLETQRREPWLFGDETTARIRQAIRERYALLPYFYTLFRHANVSGDPVLRPLLYEFPDNEATFSTEEEFMLGPAMLVRPVFKPGASSVDTFLPRESRWFDALSGQEMERSSLSWLPGYDQVFKRKVTIDHIPVFYRGGHIIARRERPRRSTQMQVNDPITLVVALDQQHKAVGQLYLDDGQSFAFKNGDFLHRSFTFQDLKLSSSKFVEHGLPEGTYKTDLKIERVVFLGLPKASSYKAKLPGGVTVDLEQGPVSLQAATSTHAYVLRAPDLPVGSDWVVQIIAGK